MPRFTLFEILNLREKSTKTSLSLEHYYASLVNHTFPQTGQMLASLFPALGSIFDTILLGFTSCGDYLVTLDSSSVRFHSISLSASQISIRGLLFRLLQNVNLGRHDGLPLWSSPIEILMCNDRLQFAATLHFASSSNRFEYEHPDEDLSICDLRLFSSGRLLASLPVSALRNESVIFRLMSPMKREKTILFTNDGSCASFFLFFESNLVAEYDEIAQDIANNTLPIELKNVKTFESKQNIEDSWFSCNIVANIPAEAINAIIIPQSKFEFEKFLRNYLLPFYYPGLDVSKSLIAFELRCLGPGETGYYILMVISAALATYKFVRSDCTNKDNHRREAVTKEIAYLIAMHPLLGEVSVLKIRDLGDLNLSHYEHAWGVAQLKSLVMKTDLYCRQIQQADPFLRHFRSSFQLMSNAEATGCGLKYLKHPFLPLHIYNDEIS